MLLSDLAPIAATIRRQEGDVDSPFDTQAAGRTDILQPSAYLPVPQPER